jgi:hypothetical protein
MCSEDASVNGTSSLKGRIILEQVASTAKHTNIITTIYKDNKN